MIPTDANPFETSYRNMAAGVLRQARQDLWRHRQATTRIEWELYQDAHRWLTSDESFWPFCFLNVCRVLNLSPEIVRRELMIDLAGGPIRYWSRRCRRGARQLSQSLARLLVGRTERHSHGVSPTGVPAQTVI